MLEMRLSYYTNKDGRIRLRFSWLMRAVFFVIGGLVGGAMAIGQNLSVFGVGLVVIAIAGALFEDSWEYRPKHGFLIRRTGLLFLKKKHTYDIMEIESFELRYFTKGRHFSPEAEQVVLSPAGTALPQKPEKPKPSPWFKNLRFAHGRRWVLLAFSHSTEGRVLVEAHSLRYEDDLPKAARALAEACHRPLEEINE